MQTFRRSQTTARDAHRGLRLPVSDTFRAGGVFSPYFQRSSLQEIGTGRDSNSLFLMIAIIEEIITSGNNYNVKASLNDSGTGLGPFTFNIPFASVTTFPDDMPALIQAGIINVCDTNSLAEPSVYQYSDAIAAFAIAIPMMVSGVAKTSAYVVVGAPAVAGGAGVARFYIDSNGDGTGTAPSEVYAPSLQAVIVNTVSAYVPTNVSVDTNRKYIDITMKALTFSGITVVGIPVLGSQSLVAAANGTTVNCTVFVKK